MAATDRAYKAAKRLRRELTLPEVLLWQILRTRPQGLKFRRQHPVGPYVLDFYCPAVKLGIEIDGIAHDMSDHPERDTRRDDWLKEQGIAVLRISARDVLAAPETVAEMLVHHCRR